MIRLEEFAFVEEVNETTCACMHKDLIKVDISRLRSFLGLKRMTSPKETI